MVIPDSLKDSIKNGQAVLCLGAGASIGAKDSFSKNIVNGNDLKDLLCDKFLGGKYKDRSLEQVAGFSMSETSQGEVEQFIREILEKFEPADFHLILPTFRWKTIYTTNYDLIIEKAYKKQTKRVQNLLPIVDNQSSTRDNNSLYYIKLHGCITRSSDISLPMILTSKQFIECEQNRDKLYARLNTDAYDYPIIFIGHSLQDNDLLEVINKTRKNSAYAPKYYLVVPKADRIEKNYWREQRIEILEATFEDFLRELDNSIPRDFRGIAIQDNNQEVPIINKIASPEIQISNNLKRFLMNDVEFVSENLRYKNMSPYLFYKGVDCAWSGISQNLDVKRQIIDEILINNVIFEEEDPTTLKFKMPLIKAPAGAGKSVLLRRIAWDATFDYQKICLYLLEYGNIDINALKELLSVSKRKIFLFVDNAAQQVKFLYNIKKIPKDDLKKLTLILCERTNEWNVNVDENENLPIETYDLNNLTYSEINELLKLLKEHNSLGYLKDKSLEEQIEIFSKNYNKQLLVALYESTRGKPFEEIIKDEYNNILPLEARYIYLTVCILNRMQIPVRAGLISSIFNINLNEFKEKFFKPLENIVYTKIDKSTQDYYYEARHPYIAEIIFNQILSNQEDRFNRYYEVFSVLNTSYDSDRKAFREMIKANNLLDLFNKNHDLICKLYDKAEEENYNDTFVLQQKAIYEMKRPNGNFSKAKEYLSIAEANEPRNTSIKHSKAELYIKIAEFATRTQIEMEQYLNEANKIIEDICFNNQVSTYCYSSRIKIGLIRLNYYINNNISEEGIKEIINNIELNLIKGLQAFPNEPILLQYEADLATILKNKERVCDSLEKAFIANPRNSNIGIRLAKLYKDINENDKAIQVLDTAIEANRSDAKIKYLKAKILFEMNELKYREDIIYLLEKSYNNNDRNFDGKLLYGRELFISRYYQKCFEVFDTLKDMYINEEVKNKINYPILNNYYGEIVNKQVNYLFIKVDNISRDIFAHLNQNEKIWELLNVGDKIKFNIGFNFKGPVAYDISKYR